MGHRRTARLPRVPPPRRSPSAPHGRFRPAPVPPSRHWALDAEASGPFRFVVSGPDPVGPAAFVRALTGGPPSSGAAGPASPSTFRWGRRDLHLVVAPGTDDAGEGWDALCRDASGLAMVLSGDRPQDFAPARRVLDALTTRHPLPFVLALARPETGRAWAPPDVAAYFGLPGGLVVGFDAADARGPRHVLARLLDLGGAPSNRPTAPG